MKWNSFPVLVRFVLFLLSAQRIMVDTGSLRRDGVLFIEVSSIMETLSFASIEFNCVVLMLTVSKYTLLQFSICYSAIAMPVLID